MSESIDDVERLGKLTARIKLLENYFRESYPAFKMYLEKEKSKIAAEFTKMWAVYRKQMKNVWKWGQQKIEMKMILFNLLEYQGK